MTPRSPCGCAACNAPILQSSRCRATTSTKTRPSAASRPEDVAQSCSTSLQPGLSPPGQNQSGRPLEKLRPQAW
eukprot:1112385-Alexandrium_andersonii.AAC.1